MPECERPEQHNAERRQPRLDGLSPEAVIGSQHVVEAAHPYRRRCRHTCAPPLFATPKIGRPITLGPAVPSLPDRGFRPARGDDAATEGTPVRPAYQARAVSPARVRGNRSGQRPRRSIAEYPAWNAVFHPTLRHNAVHPCARTAPGACYRSRNLAYNGAQRAPAGLSTNRRVRDDTGSQPPGPVTRRFPIDVTARKSHPAASVVKLPYHAI